MSLDWSRLAGASLAVAIGLVIVTAAAWFAVRALPEEEPWARIAHDHLAALAEWALGLLALHAVALILAADTGLGAWALVVVLACAAAAMHQAPAAPELEPEPEPGPEPAERAPAAPHSSLWARPER